MTRVRETRPARLTRRAFKRGLLAAAIAVVPACGIIGPEPRGLAGVWDGVWLAPPGNIQLSLDIFTVGDSVHGTADAGAMSFVIPSFYQVEGRRTSDSVHMRLRPVADADIHFAGTRYGDQINGKMWFGIDTAAAKTAAFIRR